MTIEELTQKLSGLDEASAVLRDAIHANTAKAREINAANMALIQQKKGVDKERHAVAHELRKLVDAENKRKSEESTARMQAETAAKSAAQPVG